MTIHGTGTPITMAQINAEFGRGNDLNSYRGTHWYTDAGGSGNFSSGTISMYDFYNKRLTEPIIPVEYFIVGGGAGGSYGTSSHSSGVDKYGTPYDNRTLVWSYDGNGGGGGRIAQGTMNLLMSGSYGVVVGGGGSPAGDGGASSFNGVTAAGGPAVSAEDYQGRYNGGATFSSFMLPGLFYGGGGLSGSWNIWQNANTAWNNLYAYDNTQSIYFPTTGNYVLQFTADDAGIMWVDGNVYYASGWNLSYVPQTIIYLEAGWHTVRVYNDNRGGYVAGVSFTLCSLGQYSDFLVPGSGKGANYGADGLDGAYNGAGRHGDDGTGQGGYGAGYHGAGGAGAGGSGVVAIRYPGSTQYFSGGDSIYYSGGYMIHAFYGVGSHTL